MNRYEDLFLNKHERSFRILILDAQFFRNYCFPINNDC